MTDLRSKLKTKNASIAVFLILALVIGAVSNIAGNTASLGERETTSPDYDATGSKTSPLELGGSADSSRKKATRMDLELEVPNVEEAQRQTQEMAEKHGGYVTSSHLSREPGTSGRLTVKVPDENMSSFMSDVESSWTVESRNTDIDDVTDRYTELELELENKRQELERLQELMNRSENVSDLVKIQERMGELRSRIQYLENQLEDLDRRVEYTEISLYYEEPQTFHTEFELRDSFRDAYRAVFQGLDLLIVGIGYLLPFLVVGWIIYKGRNLFRGFGNTE